MEIVIALLSGLVAALVTSCINYLVLAKVEDRKSRIKKEKLCYYYLVKMNEISALEIVIREYFGRYLERNRINQSINVMKEKIINEGSGFSLEHLIFAIIEILIQENEINDTKIFKDLPKNIKEIALEFKIEQNLVVELPESAIYHYNELIGNIKNLCDAVEYWNECYEGDIKHIEVKELYFQWQKCKAISNNLKEVRMALIEKGNIPQRLSDELLLKITNESRKLLNTGISIKEDLSDAKKFALKSRDEKLIMSKKTEPSNDDKADKIK